MPPSSIKFKPQNTNTTRLDTHTVSKYVSTSTPKLEYKQGIDVNQFIKIQLDHTHIKMETVDNNILSECINNMFRGFLIKPEEVLGKFEIKLRRLIERCTVSKGGLDNKCEDNDLSNNCINESLGNCINKYPNNRNLLDNKEFSHNRNLLDNKESSHNNETINNKESSHNNKSINNNTNNNTHNNKLKYIVLILDDIFSRSCIIGILDVLFKQLNVKGVQIIPQCLALCLSCGLQNSVVIKSYDLYTNVFIIEDYVLYDYFSIGGGTDSTVDGNSLKDCSRENGNSLKDCSSENGNSNVEDCSGRDDSGRDDSTKDSSSKNENNDKDNRDKDNKHKDNKKYNRDKDNDKDNKKYNIDRDITSPRYSTTSPSYSINDVLLDDEDYQEEFQKPKLYRKIPYYSCKLRDTKHSLKEKLLDHLKLIHMTQDENLIIKYELQDGKVSDEIGKRLRFVYYNYEKLKKCNVKVVIERCGSISRGCIDGCGCGSDRCIDGCGCGCHGCNNSGGGKDDCGSREESCKDINYDNKSDTINNTKNNINDNINNISITELIEQLKFLYNHVGLFEPNENINNLVSKGVDFFNCLDISKECWLTSYEWDKFRLRALKEKLLFYI